ncbi:MAG TPA: PSD1 and planctomycete cytochrome C domain-containing protein [Pirellulales bacterium]|nr:PSD1 and planctomycete cytochrome C domain-containing protein [Pirellulales bacterium]
MKWHVLFAMMFGLGLGTLTLYGAPQGEPSRAAKNTAKAKPAPTVDFAHDVFPILRRSCVECHGPDKQEGGLRLDQRDAALAGGDSGETIVPGHADRSELYRRVILPKEDDAVMPARGAKLTAAEVRTIQRWIDSGAAWPRTVEQAPHWAYVKPERPRPPASSNADWPKNSIDRFVLARLEAEGLAPAPEADPAILCRRLYLDLIGIPPSPRAVAEFVADRKAGAYERLVERLLAAPEFGQRWARPWLDAARYADSHGFQRDDLWPIWAYRDWVIDALNADMPFNQFTVEQLAGDLLPDATEAQRIATGFHRCAPTNVEAGSDPEETRTNQIIDRVNTTAAVWLGSTIECAQCHDHKYDPFTQRDYYGLFAFFNNTALEADRSNPNVPGSIRFLGPKMPLADPEHDAERTELSRAMAEMDKEVTTRRKALEGSMVTWESELREALATEAETHVLEIDDFDSSGGAPFKMLDDNSVLLVDDPPDIDTYTVTVKTDLTNITAFKLEALTDPSLPGNGPGRGDAERPNFVLNTFSLTQAAADEKNPRPVKFATAKADYSQANYDVAGAIDDDPKTAWAIGGKFHQPHEATFTTAQPVGSADGATFTFTLVQKFGAGRTIGRLRLSAMTGDPRAKAVPDEIVKILRLSPEKRKPGHVKKLVDYRVADDKIVASLEAKRRKLDDRLKAIPKRETLVMQENTPRSTAVFMRGDFRTPGMAVEPAVPAVLQSGSLEGRDRLALARWLVDRQNPLTARVTVNRWWAELFGHGLVTTVEDFGIKGEAPTHPELLDWLAVEFMDTGWSMKRLLKTIVTSATYRQSSRLTPELLAADDQNLLYARGPRVRMDAEMIRDNALAAAGLLNVKHGGPPIKPYQPDGLWTKVGGAKVDYVVSPGDEKYRRGVYVVLKRGSPYPSFVNFDATARLACKLRRSRSNTPLQALTLLNDPVYVEASIALARRVVTDRANDDLDGQLRYAFQLCLARAPRGDELETLRRLFEAQRMAASRDPAHAERLLKGADLPSTIAPADFVAWYSIATALMNLDEMITKG